ncbi:MAG: hypothetical protein ABFR05_07545 [Bacteroidota bacterium]
MSKLIYLEKKYFLSPISILLFLGLMALTVSCSTVEAEKNITFFGGKIKNPKDKYVYFAKDEVVIDSVILNEHNRFKFSIDSIEEGIYTFKHGPEFQYLYLQPKDSLLIYLNTWDFDESLIFSGKGGAKNNFLINVFLQQEENQKRFHHKYNLEEEEFSKEINYHTSKLHNQYVELMESENDEATEFFKKVADVAINYPFYYHKERYPFYHRKTKNLKEFPELSEKFYAFREGIDLNDKSLIFYSPYFTYLRTHLYHLAYAEKIKYPDSCNVDLNFMKVVNDKIKIEYFKNDLLANGIWDALINESLNKEDFNDVRDYFTTNCNDDELKAEIEKSIAQKEKLNSGDTLPTIMLLNDERHEIAINKIVKGSPTVIYFWPKHLGKTEILIEQLDYLKKEYPNYSFIGIEREKSYDNWRNFVSDKNLDSREQYKIDKNSSFYTWFEGDMARTILLDKNGIIQNGYLFFNAKTLDYYLKKP